jgi:hypothetical protein
LTISKPAWHQPPCTASTNCSVKLQKCSDFLRIPINADISILQAATIPALVLC